MSNAVRLEKLRRKMKADFRTFFKATEPERYGETYKYGVHTNALINICQSAFEKFKQGISSYIIVNVPARHGKSDVISRRFPPWVLINNPRLEIMEGCATGNLSTKMSRSARECFEGICSLYGTKNKKDANTKDSWETLQGGGLHSSGLDGTIVGHGADVLVIDDYLKNRQAAESQLVRDKVWGAFQSDFMPRLAPVHIVIIVATRWHVDDLCGRIKDINDPTHDNYNEAFPIFETIIFPAQNSSGEYLFPERFSNDYYKANKNFLGAYGWQSQAMQEPKGRVGNILKAERCKIVDEIKHEDGMYWHLGIDLAHSDLSGKGDPDFTVLTLASFFKGKIYVKKVLRIRETALKRDELIKNTVALCPPGTDFIIEVVGASKDTFIYFRKQLRRYITVRPYKNHFGKHVHATILEPIFELGDVIIEKGDWNMGWINELKAFPSGKHDDQLDSLFVAISREMLKNNYRNYIDKDKVNTHNEETEQEMPKEFSTKVEVLGEIGLDEEYMWDE